MAALPSNTTDRLRLHYNGPKGTHTMMLRAPDGETEAGLVEDAQNLVTLMVLAQFQGTVWDTADYAPAGSDVFLPEAGWTPITSASGINPSAGQAPSTFVEFGGRSAGGRRVKLYLFETFFQYTDDMRYQSGESAILDDIVDQLNDAGSEICAIDGLATTWYSYVNVGQNDYITHRARRS
jgi:hypothetical protein